MLIHEIDQLALRFERPAQLPAWVGTELRGMVKEHFKRGVCCHPELDGLSEDECQTIALPECSTCPAELREDCPYALAFEPGAMNSDLRTGEEPARPLVLAPAFPTPERFAAGDTLDFRVLLIGRAVEAVHPLLEAIAIAGWERGLGPTKSRVPVLLENLHLARHRQHRLDLASLPARDDPQLGTVPRVCVEITAPLSLLNKQQPGRPLITQPTCTDLVKASISVVTGLARWCGEPCEIDKPSLLAAADKVPVLAYDLGHFQQTVRARQGAQRVEFEALAGTARDCWGAGRLILSDVPRSLLPWLEWGGRLHVGNRRSAGAGSWRLLL